MEDNTEGDRNSGESDSLSYLSTRKQHRVGQFDFSVIVLSMMFGSEIFSL